MVPDHADQARGLAAAARRGGGSSVVVTSVSLRDFRSYARQELDLPPGLVVIVGPNGAGKTNLIEAVHVGTQGFSLRTRRESRAVRFGAESALVSVRGERRGGRSFTTEVTVGGESRRTLLDGAAVESADELRRELPVLAFTPDRLAVVKGGPAVRRAYLDRMLGRLFPARAGAPADYGRALAQRNAALRRARDRLSSPAAVAPWTETLARLGNELEHARADAVSRLAERFAAHAERLGLGSATLEYVPEPLGVERLHERLDRDLERGLTGVGPHLRDVRIAAGARDLRAYGSQGEQRTAVLALVLAEADATFEARGEPALLLLDDVLSELDDHRRSALLEALRPEGQTLVTATSLRSLPGDAPRPAGVVDVRPGEARRR